MLSLCAATQNDAMQATWCTTGATLPLLALRTVSARHGTKRYMDPKYPLYIAQLLGCRGPTKYYLSVHPIIMRMGPLHNVQISFRTVLESHTAGTSTTL
jgi:hypothetical protein